MSKPGTERGVGPAGGQELIQHGNWCWECPKCGRRFEAHITSQSQGLTKSNAARHVARCQGDAR